MGIYRSFFSGGRNTGENPEKLIFAFLLEAVAGRSPEYAFPLYFETNAEGPAEISVNRHSQILRIGGELWK